MNNTPKTFVESMRELCADDVRLPELALLNPVDELVPAIPATLADLPEGWPLRKQSLDTRKTTTAAAPIEA
jgi:hypothetical protein